MIILQRILLVSLFCLIAGFITPSHAAVAAKSTVNNMNTAIDLQKVKKLSFKEKIKLIRQLRSEIKAAKKISPKGTKSILQNRLFLIGLILTLAGLVVGALRIPIVSWLAGLVALAGFIMMIVALLREYT